jgi:hypothetical protein
MKQQGLIPAAVAAVCLFVRVGTAPAQTPAAPPAVVAGIPVNYDEALTGSYKLPDPLVLRNGKRVKTPQDWTKKRRPEILRMFEENQFGASPGRPKGMVFDVFDKGTAAFAGKAVRRQVTIYFSEDRSGPKADLLLYLPAGAKGRVPVLLNLNFAANSSVVADPGVKHGEIWGKERKLVPAPQNSMFGKLNVEPLLAKGFGVATMYYGDIDPDFADGAQLGVRRLYLKPGQTRPGPGEWGAIAAWAWGVSRAVDYLETDEGVDGKKIAILGVSRLGKTVLWAGAQDPRIALVVASCSGEGGAALGRRIYGETVKHMGARFGYQFCENYQKWGDHPEQMPMDAHMLVALMAPRAVLLQTGDKDLWSDPKGEFLSAVAAGPVFQLFGKQGVGTEVTPPAGKYLPGQLGYYMHAGGHGMVPSDWDVIVQFLEEHLR